MVNAQRNPNGVEPLPQPIPKEWLSARFAFRLHLCDLRHDLARSAIPVAGVWV
jgi:hypothetical protein